MCLEAELIERTAQGDVLAFEEIAKIYYGSLYSFFYRMLMDKQYSENLVQETFLRVFRYSKTFDSSRKARSWMFSVASNVAKDWINKKSMSMEIPFDHTLFPHQSNEPSVTDQVMNKEKGDMVVRALACLNEKHRRVFILRHFHGLKYDEIADVTGTSKGTVKSRMHYACKQLQKLLSCDGCYGDKGGDCEL